MDGKTLISQTKAKRNLVGGVSDLEQMRQEQVIKSRQKQKTMNTMCSTTFSMKLKKQKVLSQLVKGHRLVETAESATSVRASGLQEVETRWQLLSIKTMIQTTLLMTTLTRVQAVVKANFRITKCPDTRAQTIIYWRESGLFLVVVQLSRPVLLVAFRH